MLYFQNKAVYRAEDRPADICSKMTFTRWRWKLKIFNFSFFWRHVKTKNTLNDVSQVVLLFLCTDCCSVAPFLCSSVRPFHCCFVPLLLYSSVLLFVPPFVCSPVALLLCAYCFVLFFLSIHLKKGLFTWRWGTPGRWGNPPKWGNPPLHIISHFYLIMFTW